MFHISLSLNAMEDQENWWLVLLCTALPEEKGLGRREKDHPSSHVLTSSSDWEVL